MVTFLFLLFFKTRRYRAHHPCVQLPLFRKFSLALILFFRIPVHPCFFWLFSESFCAIFPVAQKKKTFRIFSFFASFTFFFIFRFVRHHFFLSLQRVRVHRHSGKWEYNEAEGCPMWSDTASFVFDSPGDIVRVHNPTGFNFASPCLTHG